MTYCLRRRRCRAIAAVATAAATAAAVAAVPATNAVSVAVTAICWLSGVCPAAASVSSTIACPHHCHCWLPMSLATALIVATIAAETAVVATTERLDLSPGLIFKILHIKSNILNIKLDEEGGSQNGRGDGSDDEGNNGDDERRRRRWQRQRWLQRQWRWRQC